jgi:hypothetical protein
LPYPLLTEAEILPRDGFSGALAARVFRPEVRGPAIAAIRADGVFDVTGVFPTMRDLAETENPAAALRAAPGERIGGLADIVANTPPDARDAKIPWLLAPIDLQAIKAAGVTFVTSMLERVIEERARGNPESAVRIRAEMGRLIGEDLRALKPGSPQAERVKAALIAEGAWSQYLEVGIGPDAEIFTKAQPMSAVGCGADAGFHASSQWSNPEPEAVLLVASDGRIVGATLGNDVNLRDFEGRSALLLGKAKDQNASARSARSCACSTRRSRSTTSGRWRFRSTSRARTASASRAARRCARSAAIPPTSRPADRAASRLIPTAPRSISERCSRRSPTATRQARASPTSRRHRHGERRKSSGGWSTA